MPTVRIKGIGGAFQDTAIEGIELSITVGAFKDLVKEKTGVEKEHQRIIFSGRVLADDSTLAASGVTDGAQVMLVRVQQRAGGAAPAQPSAPAQPARQAPRSLFGGPPAPQQPAGGGGGGGGGMGMGGMGMGGGISHGQAAAFLQSPQGRQLIDQMAANPQQFLQMLPPEARNSPEVQALVRDPAALRERLESIVMQSMMMGAGGLGGGGPLVPRDIFDLAMDCLNGAEIPPEYRFEIRFQGPDGRPIDPPAPGSGFGGGLGGGAAGAAGEEYVSRDAINAALDACVRDGLITDVPRGVARGAAADDARSEAALSDAATAGSAVGSVADVADNMELDEQQGQAGEADASGGAGGGGGQPSAGGGGSSGDGDGGGGSMSVDAPAERFAAQLAQLKAMGFDNEQACLQALEAAGGDVETALQFLS